MFLFPQNLLKKYIHSDAGVVAALRLFQYDHILFQQAERNMCEYGYHSSF